MRCLTSLALLAATAPVGLALDEGYLVQAAAIAREAILEVDIGNSNLTQYGEPVQITVHPVNGADIPVKFRSGMRLQILMHSVCSKLGCEVASASFSKEGRQLDPTSTATAFGLSNGDVVEVSTPELLQQAADAKRLASSEARRIEMMSQAREELMQQESIRFEKRRQVAKRVAKRAAEEERKHRMQLKDEITLKFTNPIGGEDVSMGVKRANWLEGYLELVAKRMGLDRTKTIFLFKDDDGAFSALEPHDSVQTLGLEDDEIIAVKVAHKH